MYGNPIKCPICKHTYAIFGERVNWDYQRLKVMSQYDIWKLGVRIHIANCVNRRTTEILGGVYPL